MRRVVVLFGISLAVSLSTPMLAQTATEQVIYRFDGASDGAFPIGALVQAADGNLYGTTSAEGIPADCPDMLIQGCGTVFKLSPSGGAFSAVYQFTGWADGDEPFAGLTQGGDGNFYGTTTGGPAFKLTPAGAVVPLPGDYGGEFLMSPLVQGADGDFYGTSAFRYGSVFKIDSSGNVTTLHSFQDNGSDGNIPYGGLVQALDGNFYGATTGAGAGYGTVYKMTPSGTFNVIHNFAGETDDLGDAETSLVQAADGKLYATADASFFKISTGGAFTDIYDPDVQDPQAGLVEASDGNFYGVLLANGPQFFGSVVQLTPAGKITVLYYFQGGDDGFQPRSALIQGSDGNLYGTTEWGGNPTLCQTPYSYGCGTVYKITLSPPLPAPVQLTLSSQQTIAGTPVTANWKVLNAHSLSLQQCYAFVNSGRGFTPLGKLPGSYNATTKIYSGSAVLNPAVAWTYNYALTCGGQESASATLTVKPAYSVTFATSPNPITVGQTITLHFAVTAPATPVGTVTFSYNGKAFNSQALNGAGQASFAFNTNGFSATNYTLTATYVGTPQSSTSTATVRLGVAETNTTLTVSPNPVTSPGKVTLTATVSRLPAGASGVPSGSVALLYIPVSGPISILGSAPLNANGVATLSISSDGIPSGDYQVAAAYGGNHDAGDAASTSLPLMVTVQ